ncbi:cycloartenol synthase 1 [Perilla frutescens var. frutescens]|nr:cycloartenol synthase 1 [Perilla frutescens var. frutescens]
MWKLKVAEGGGRWVTSSNNHTGRQYWEFDSEAAVSAEEAAEIGKMRDEFKKNRQRRKQSSDLLMRMQLRKENPCAPVPAPIKLKEESDEITKEAIITTLRRALTYFSTIQAHDGHWPAESAGPLFFLPPLVMALYITGDLDSVLSSEHKKEMRRYTYNHQNEDGGWGLHVEGSSTMFGSVLNYIALRLLGEGPQEETVAGGRKWILEHGGAVGIPSWGKFWLTVLGVHEWAGCNPFPPELCLLPTWFPINAGMIECNARLAYIPMSYLYGKRFVGPKTALVSSLRQEIYTQTYHKINWNKARKTCAKEDLHYPQSVAQGMVMEFLHNLVEPLMSRWPFSKLREMATTIAMEHLHYEDINTNYLCIGCVGKELCLVACWAEAPDSEAYKRHLARIPDYFWIAEDGMKLQALGSQTWDASLGVQAILSSDLVGEYGPTLRKAHKFLKASQVGDNPCGDFGKMWRHASKGGWAFSIQDHGWQASDCTAEGLKAALLLSENVGLEFQTHRFYDAVNVILSLQSGSGGFPAWEPQRAPWWMEEFNPLEFAQDFLIERDYVECTSSAIQSLMLFKKLHPTHRRGEIESCIGRAINYIEEAQESDGSWYGCWGVCYTYAIWFAVEALVDCGKTYHNSHTLRKACQFLLSKQLPDGGWGETHLSSSNKAYTNVEGNTSNLVQTSWALLALIGAGQVEIDLRPINRGIRLLVNSQMEDGDFPQQNITGVFFKNFALNFSSYRNIFPIWALGKYRRHVLGA